MTSANELLELLICPSCGRRLQSLQICDDCDTHFSLIDGTAALSRKRQRTVSFQFDQERSIVAEEFRQSFQYTARARSRQIKNAISS